MIAPSAGAVLGGSLITKTVHDSIHVLVTLTSMHASFGMETVNQWVMKDLARQEEGTLDSLAYLTESMRLLMTVAQRQKDFGTMCEFELGNQKDNLGQIEATIPNLKNLGVFSDKQLAEMEKCANLMRFQSSQLESMAALHAANAFQVSQVIDRLEERIHAVLHASPVGKARRH
ncbi:MAG: hypothetical protein IT343_04110 [Candidatus Melainabacteria bacterium]|jgi:hypothetical protein|nr:hypothetical protein [Candidatus Melainabacteria bacterium]